MSWALRFRIRQYVRGSLWMLPLAGGVLGAVLGVIDVLIDQSIHLPSSLTYSPSTATTVLSAVVGAMAALTGFVVTVTVLVVQMAIGAFSARYLRLWYRDRTLKVLLALLIGTLAFSFALLRHVKNNFVPNLGVALTAILVVACLLLFLVFLDRYLHRLRPVAVAVLVASYVDRDFKQYAASLVAAPDIYSGSFQSAGGSPAVVVRSPIRGAIQAIDISGLVAWAREHGQLVVVRHMAGDFVVAGTTLVEVYGGQESGARAERTLAGMIALGVERTIEQDPAFALRVMVDIADLALSAAVNDPTTAVQVLDHLGDVLRVIGTVDLRQAEFDPTRGIQTGLVLPVRRWEDYLTLATTEIRIYGAAAIQVMRRMRAMLEELAQDVLPEHRPAVAEELARLDATVQGHFGDSVDFDRAATADAQGIGGRNSSKPGDDRVLQRP